MLTLRLVARHLRAGVDRWAHNRGVMKSGPRADPSLAKLIDEFDSIRREMLSLVADSSDLLEQVHPNHTASARNLLDYLAFRGRDRRPLQARLAEAGLSSLGRAESHVLAAVETVLFVLLRLAGRDASAVATPDRVDMAAGQRLLDAHTEAVLGPRPNRGSPSW